MADATNKAPWFWVRDAQGFPSVTVTLVTVAFWVTAIAYVLSIFQKIGPVEIRQFDVAACGVFLTPLLGLYFGRKFTDRKYSSDQTVVNSPSSTETLEAK